MCDDPDALAGGKRELVAPNGTRIEIVEANPPMVVPPTQHAFMVRHLRDGDPWVIGRAGMHYRDLLPGRLGGSIIASHIRIPRAARCPTWCTTTRSASSSSSACTAGCGWSTRTRARPSSSPPGTASSSRPRSATACWKSGDGLEVIEIGVPAEHMTTIDHEMELPNRTVDPAREFQGQRFIRHEAAKAVRQPFRIDGFSMRDTGIAAATRGVAGVQVARPEPGWQPDVTSHDTDILFDFVMSGHMTLAGEGQEEQRLKPGDAFVVPPAMKTVYRDCTDDLELLEVCLPGAFTTTHHEHLEGERASVAPSPIPRRQKVTGWLTRPARAARADPTINILKTKPKLRAGCGSAIISVVGGCPNLPARAAKTLVGAAASGLANKLLSVGHRLPECMPTPALRGAPRRRQQALGGVPGRRRVVCGVWRAVRDAFRAFGLGVGCRAR